MIQPPSLIAVAAADGSATQSDWLRLVDRSHDEPGFWWLDSALPGRRLGRFSFAGSDPYLCLAARGTRVTLEVRRAIRPGLAIGIEKFDADPIEVARSLLPRTDSIVYSTGSLDQVASNRVAREAGWHEGSGVTTGLEIPFMGGAVGYLGYELAGTLESSLRFENEDDLDLPDLSLAYVDHVLAYDHEAERLWIMGLGFAAQAALDGPDTRDDAIAASRNVVESCLDRLCWPERDVHDVVHSREGRTRSGREGLPAPSAESAPTVPFTSTVDASGYAKAVDSILQEIEAGNVYQANYSQRLVVDSSADSWSLYLALRKNNPAPFGAYLQVHASGAAILSSSPERFLRLDGLREVESRPIKGTRPRGSSDVEDEAFASELARSPKDRAENLMIVDLVRNDLGRVCVPGSISVPELMKIETYAEVFQMVSTVWGQLAAGRDGFDLVRASFPPGSMTGAPKLAAISLLESLETTRRGIYAGALGYFDLRGGFDLSVVIRTIVSKDGRAYLHVGGGIVADSDPAAEYLESLDKARAPLAALNEANEGRVDANTIAAADGTPSPSNTESISKEPTA